MRRTELSDICARQNKVCDDSNRLISYDEFTLKGGLPLEAMVRIPHFFACIALKLRWYNQLQTPKGSVHYATSVQTL